MWHDRALPAGPGRIGFWVVLRGSVLPILVWAGVAAFAYVLYNPLAAMVLGGLFALSFVVGFGLRRRARHSVRCSVYGAVGGVFDTSMAGF
ncbi:hypothetical protein ACFQ64_36135 [Streptomyces sp. NPDC056460]|uniref:hypothetical protein n=1 Tax=Streptomyces sp. NPDC056460 TaxID=3345825 RepID=UPI0036C9CE00